MNVLNERHIVEICGYLWVSRSKQSRANTIELELLIPRCTQSLLSLLRYRNARVDENNSVTFTDELLEIDRKCEGIVINVFNILSDTPGEIIARR